MIRSTTLLLALAIASGVASAALPPRSVEDLAAQADTVVVGFVEDVASEAGDAENGRSDTHWRVRVRVESVEKGADVQALTARAWTVLKRPRGWVGPSGVTAVAGTVRGQHVRLFLRTAGREFEILEPNGLQTLELAPPHRP